jgi:hypothetical protein
MVRTVWARPHSRNDRSSGLMPKHCPTGARYQPSH